MLAWLTNGTRNALVLFVLLAAIVAAIIGATHHASVAVAAADRAMLLEVIHAPAASPESVAEPAHSPVDAPPMAGESSVNGAIVLGCALFVLCCVALLLRRLRVAREAAILAGGAGVRGPTVVGPFVPAPSLPPSPLLLSISRT